MREVVIAGAVRTAIGKFGGSLARIPAVELGATVVGESKRRAGVSPEEVDEVILGHVLQAGGGSNPAGQAALKAGLPVTVPATRAALERAGVSLEAVEAIELNEAFAAQSIAVIAELGLDPARLNLNGGAIALGHPVGASGARIIVTLLHIMAERNMRLGLATLCVGGGQGMATILESCAP